MTHQALANTAGRWGRRVLAGAACVLALAGCHQDMWNQPKFRGLRPNSFFEDGASARPVVEGTVPYAGAARKWTAPVFARLSGHEHVPGVLDAEFWHGQTADGTFRTDNYFKITPELLERGRERYEITCRPCHGSTGDGMGLIVSRGFPQAASYHIDRLREVEDGYIFDVITRGFGRMYSYAARVAPEDRWAITAYVRALQLSQNVNLEALPAQDRQAIEQAIEAAAHPKPEAETHGTHHVGH